MTQVKQALIDLLSAWVSTTNGRLSLLGTALVLLPTYPVFVVGSELGNRDFYFGVGVMIAGLCLIARACTYLHLALGSSLLLTARCQNAWPPATGYWLTILLMSICAWDWRKINEP